MYYNIKGRAFSTTLNNVKVNVSAHTHFRLPVSLLFSLFVYMCGICPQPVTADLSFLCYSTKEENKNAK